MLLPVQFESSSDAVVHAGCPVDMVLVASSTAFQHTVITVMNCSPVLCLFVLFSVHFNRTGDTGSNGLCLGFCNSFARVWSGLVPRRLDSAPLYSSSYVSGLSHSSYLTTGDHNGSNNFRPKFDCPLVQITVSSKVHFNRSQVILSVQSCFQPHEVSVFFPKSTSAC